MWESERERGGRDKREREREKEREKKRDRKGGEETSKITQNTSLLLLLRHLDETQHMREVSLVDFASLWVDARPHHTQADDGEAPLLQIGNVFRGDGELRVEVLCGVEGELCGRKRK